MTTDDERKRVQYKKLKQIVLQEVPTMQEASKPSSNPHIRIDGLSKIDTQVSADGLNKAQVTTQQSSASKLVQPREAMSPNPSREMSATLKHLNGAVSSTQ